MDLVEDLNRTASGWATPYSDLLEQAAKEIVRLNLELQKRDKCAYMGPMRDCPTHGEGSELKALRSLCRQLYEAELIKNQQDWTAVIRALEKIGADSTAAG